MRIRIRVQLFLESDSVFPRRSDQDTVKIVTLVLAVNKIDFKANNFLLPLNFCTWGGGCYTFLIWCSIFILYNDLGFSLLVWCKILLRGCVILCYSRVLQKRIRNGQKLCSIYVQYYHYQHALQRWHIARSEASLWTSLFFNYSLTHFYFARN